MRQFGNYETVQELFRGGLGSVFSARPAGGTGGPTVAIRTCEPVAEIIGESQAKEAVAHFVAAAEVQRQAAASGGTGDGGSHWAPVHEIGETPYGAYYVTDLFENGSLERLSLGRVRMDARALHRLMSGVAAGLAEIRRACGRPHGNLKPSNILVSFTGGLESARVALADPLAPALVDAERDAAEDLRALGRAMYLAVFNQPLREGTVLPLPPSPQWSALGKAGDRWRELCSALLEPERRTPPMTLEAAAEEIEALGQIRAGSANKTVLIASAAAGVVVVGAVAAVLLKGPAPADPSGPEPGPVVDPGFSLETWQYVCRACWDWFATFAEDIEDPAVREVLSRDAHIDALVKRIDAAKKAGVKLHPKQFAGLEDFRLGSQSSKEDAPEAAKTDAAVRDTAAAAEVIRAVEEGLAEGKWPALAAMKSASAAFGERGWDEGRRALDALIAGAAPSPRSVLSVGLERLIEAAPVVSAIQSDWAEVEGAEPELAKTGDQVLAKFMEWAKEHAAGGASADASGKAGIEVIRALAARVAEVADLAEDLEEFAVGEWETIDAEEFWARSDLHRDLDGRKPDAAMFKEWLFHAPSHRALSREADPRRGWVDEPLELAQAREVAVQISEYLASKNREPEEEDKQRARELEELAERVKALKELRWSVSNRAAIETETPRVIREAADLKVRLERRLTDMRTDDIQGFADAQARLRERQSVTASAALNEAWRVRRDALIAEVAAAPGGGDTATLRRRARELEESIVALDTAVEPAELPSEVGGGAWIGAIGAAVAEQREKVLAETLASLAPGASLESAGVAAAERYRVVRAELLALAADASSLQRLLDLGYGLQEPAGESDAAGEVLARLESALADAPRGVREAMAPLLERGAQLRAIAASEDRGGLAEMVREARADVPERALAAWRRLGGLGWPRGLAELEQERALRESLGRVVGALRDDQRRTALEAEFASESLARFQRAAVGLTTPEEMESALALMGDFGLSPERLTDQGLKFNVMLRALRRELAQEGLEEARAQELVGEFITRARAEAGDALAASDAARGVVDRLVAALGAAGAPRERPPTDFSKLGPGATGPGWQVQVLGDGAEVVYSREGVRGAGGRGTGRLELRFVRVPTGEGTGVYLLANELSLGQFVGIISAAQRWEEMAELLRAEDGRRAPCVWEADRAGLSAARFWTQNHPLVSPMRPTYADGLRPEGLARSNDTAPNSAYNQISPEQGAPSLEMPMQQVPIGAAMFAARLAGCRLPTEAEWRAALAQDGGIGDLQGWNLRDATWARQRDHVRSVREEMVRSNTNGSQRFLWPDDASFGLSVLGLTEAVPREAEAVAHPHDDGRLWFAPAADGTGGQRRFSHLIGNVAEYVFEDAAALEAQGVEDALEFESLADRHADKVGIIGGSSMSPPNLALDSAYRPNPDDWFTGFADVGIRLAFSADGAMGPERFNVVALRAADPSGYVLGR